MNNRTAILLGLYAGVMTALVIRNTKEIYWLTQAVGSVVEVIDRDHVDASFVDIVEGEDWD